MIAVHRSDEGHPGERESGHESHRFGSGILDDLAKLTVCGLSWTKMPCECSIDVGSSEPATVVHEAQALYEELGGQRLQGQASERMAAGAGRSKVRGPDAASLIASYRIAQAKRRPRPRCPIRGINWRGLARR